MQTWVPLPVIQRRLAHEPTTDTSDTYGYLTDNAETLSADSMDGMDGLDG